MKVPQNAEDILKIAEQQDLKQIPHKHLLALADLCRQGKKHVEFSFSGSGDEGDIDGVYTDEGVFECEYEDELREWAIDKFTDLCPCDWINNAGGGGTLTVRIPSLEIVVDSYYNVQDTVAMGEQSYNLVEVN